MVLQNAKRRYHFYRYENTSNVGIAWWMKSEGEGREGGREGGWRPPTNAAARQQQRSRE